MRCKSCGNSVDPYRGVGHKAAPDNPRDCTPIPCDVCGEPASAVPFGVDVLTRGRALCNEHGAKLGRPTMDGWCFARTSKFTDG